MPHRIKIQPGDALGVYLGRMTRKEFISIYRRGSRASYGSITLTNTNSAVGMYLTGSVLLQAFGRWYLVAMYLMTFSIGGGQHYPGRGWAPPRHFLRRRRRRRVRGDAVATNHKFKSREQRSQEKHSTKLVPFGATYCRYRGDHSWRWVC